MKTGTYRMSWEYELDGQPMFDITYKPADPLLPTRLVCRVYDGRDIAKSIFEHLISTESSNTFN